ncbi:MAG: hypothetical protein ACLVJH_17535 [Faecalibacterium prausnitzii]
MTPIMLTPEYITRLAAVDKLCPQYHLSLQSGCSAHPAPDAPRLYRRAVRRGGRQLRAAYGDRPVSFTTDCICGFPGETEEDFGRAARS